MKAWGECMAEMDPPAFRFVLDVLRVLFQFCEGANLGFTT
jgi:hypothetical protein